jgi:putative heme-binding domain-containing protein
MRSFALLLLFVPIPLVTVAILPVSLPAQDRPVELVASTEPLTPAEQVKKFRLPKGFQIELVAAEPDVPKPINIAFDAAGRLYATCSTEYPFPAAEGQGKDRIQRIDDTNGDGVPDKVSTFATGLNIPIGVAAVHDGVIGHSIPRIWKFVDRDGDGVADEQRPAYNSIGFRDTHGMASSFNWWLDGWVYACHGFSNESKVQGADGREIVMQSGNTYRLRPDGSHVEYFTHGQVNPFGMAFDHLGNLYTADCHSRPLYMLLRGAYYPSFGKPHDGLGFGPEMIAHSHGSTGICGLAFYEATNFPPEYFRTMFIGNPVTGRVNHDRLEQHGAGYKAVEQPDFIVCDDPWFRPVDLKVGPDGALYIADFYNRIIGHYEVPLTHPQRDRERGRIWRVTYTGRDVAPVVDLTKASVETLLATLGDANLGVRTQAVHQLVHRVGQPAVASLVESLGKPLSPQARVHTLWALERLGALTDDQLAASAASEQSEVRTHVGKLLASRGTWRESDRLLALRLMADADPFVVSSAGDALGLHPDKTAIPALLAALDKVADDNEHGRHVLRMALRDHVALLADWNTELASSLSSPTAVERIADVSLGVQSASAAGFLTSRWTSLVASLRVGEYVGHLVRQTPAEELTGRLDLLASRRSEITPVSEGTVLRAGRSALDSRGQPLPASWSEWALAAVDARLAKAAIDGGKAVDEAAGRDALELARDLRVVARSGAIAKFAAPESVYPNVRQLALESLVAINAAEATPALLVTVTTASLPEPLRQRAAELLGGLGTGPVRAAVTSAWPLMPDAIALFLVRGLAGSKEGATFLFDAVAAGKSNPRHLRDTVVEAKLRGLKSEELIARWTELTRDIPPDDARAVALIAARKQGFSGHNANLSRGEAVFKKQCANCHRLNNAGGKVGPDLDGVGLRGLDRLLEDTLTPSRNVDQAFRARLFQLNDGTSLSGLVLREEGEVIVVANAEGKEVPVRKGVIEDSAELKLSPMPANVAELVSEAEFYDLVAWLLNQRVAKAKE